MDQEAEQQLLLPRQRIHGHRTTAIIWTALTGLFVVGLIVVFTIPDDTALRPLPQDPLAAARKILKVAPVFDGHVDLPILVRSKYNNNVSAVDLDAPMPGHVDIPRLREGHAGGFFWSVYVGCPTADVVEDPDFLQPNWRVRDTLEQIDVSRLLIDKYPETFRWTPSSRQIREAISRGKIAALLGVEGAHQIGNSIAVLRQYYDLGVRYMTLTHTCHNAFADSGGYLEPLPKLHGGLSSLGYKLIDEMNRLGVLVDLSHTSDDTASQALQYSRAPVIWSHSSARAVHNVARNVPDYILKMIKDGTNDAVVMVNFAPQFVAKDGEANITAVADHVEHLADIAGKKHVGIGSDFDGIGDVPEGLEDVSKYPALFAELYKRGWNRYDLMGLSGANFMRVFEVAERVAAELQREGVQPVMDLYDKRPDFLVDRQEL